MAENGSENTTAPFVPWNTFKGFIKSELKEKVVPAKIDSSMFPDSKSGTDKRLLRSALRFHGLVRGAEDETTDRLRALVKAFGTDDWKSSVTDLLRNYDPILKSLNVAEATQGELDDAFRDNGDVTGSTLKKAVRLYLAMATEAGVKLSPHFTPLRGATEGAESTPPSGAPASNGASAKGKPRRRAKSTPSSAETNDMRAPDGVAAIEPLPGQDFKVWIPKDLTEAEFTFGMKYVCEYLNLKRKWNLKVPAASKSKDAGT